MNVRAMRAIVRRVYGGADAKFDPQAMEDFARIEALGFARLPVCMAKTPMSLTDDPKRLGCPEGFTVRVRRARLGCAALSVIDRYCALCSALDRRSLLSGGRSCKVACQRGPLPNSAIRAFSRCARRRIGCNIERSCG